MAKEHADSFRNGGMNFLVGVFFLLLAGILVLSGLQHLSNKDKSKTKKEEDTHTSTQEKFMEEAYATYSTYALNVTFEELLEDPQRVRELSPDEVATLLGKIKLSLENIWKKRRIHGQPNSHADAVKFEKLVNLYDALIQSSAFFGMYQEGFYMSTELSVYLRLATKDINGLVDVLSSDFSNPKDTNDPWYDPLKN